MPIDFGPERWDRLKETYDAWWDGKLDRPIIPAILWGKGADRPVPSTPFLTQATCTNLSLSPDDIIDRIDYELSTRVYLGDAFPYVSLDVFGPGVAAAFLGATLDNSTGSVWFHAPENLELADLHFEFQPSNKWLGRIKDICAAAMRRWQGAVLVGMTDLGGTLDILSTFRPSALLPLDLYDSPAEVKRLVWELHNLWFKFYDEIHDVLLPTNPGYTNWSGIYSSSPSYMLQCDFAYMIGPAMFDEFVVPELTASCKRLSRSFYHLDGPGQIPHLDSLIAIDELHGIQWIPGDGNGFEWDDLYRRIYSSGKLMQVIGGRTHLDSVVGLLGSGKNICAMTVGAHISESDDMLTWLARHGITETL